MTQIFKSVISHATQDDNPASKIRSIMLKSVAGSRDLGQCEISRLLLSEPHYRSSFIHITVSLELNKREINCHSNTPNSPATKWSLLDYYAMRKTNPLLIKHDHLLLNFLEFAKRFYISKNNLVLCSNPDLTVVITHPTVQYQPLIKEIYNKYCFYQMIKYSSWTIENLPEISNELNATERWETFLSTASETVKTALRFVEI